MKLLFFSEEEEDRLWLILKMHLLPLPSNWDAIHYLLLENFYPWSYFTITVFRRSSNINLTLTVHIFSVLLYIFKFQMFPKVRSYYFIYKCASRSMMFTILVLSRFLLCSNWFLEDQVLCCFQFSLHLSNILTHRLNNCGNL